MGRFLGKDFAILENFFVNIAQIFSQIKNQRAIRGTCKSMFFVKDEANFFKKIAYRDKKMILNTICIHFVNNYVVEY